ncbi:hypothetical protein VNO78_13883 [Psophocarpus tetragonolobus]|uniref:Cell wall protein n=1 Tax=Psophocarpus tetragonolobus TaxID=3891 RepID=A0AAN9SY79_PSOTE
MADGGWWMVDSGYDTLSMQMSCQEHLAKKQTLNSPPKYSRTLAIKCSHSLQLQHKTHLNHIYMMACKPSSFLALLIITTLLLVTAWQTVAGRHIGPENSNKGDKKEPQFLFPPDGYIPGIGRVELPPFFVFTPQNPDIGGSVPAAHGNVPGGDDSFVPNPGSGGGVPVPVPVPVPVHP